MGPGVDLRERAVELPVNESTQSQDVTRQYVDLDSRLRNYRVEEARYVEIMKRAGQMEDVLQVTKHLSDVRGRIEQSQGELNYLAHQVDMSTITASLIVQAQARVLGIEWRPLYNARRVLRDMLEGLAGWVDSMVAVLIYLLLILLWSVTILFPVAVAWKIRRFVRERFFSRPPAAPQS